MLRYNLTRYCTQYNNFKGKTSARFRIHETQLHLKLTGELWLSSVSYLDKSDSEISRVHCICAKKTYITIYRQVELQTKSSMWIYAHTHICIWILWHIYTWSSRHCHCTTCHSLPHTTRQIPALFCTNTKVYVIWYSCHIARRRSNLWQL